MPNAFAYLVFYSWPLVVYVIFRKQPLVPALAWSMVLGYILLPSRVELDLPAFPAIGRYEITSISAAIMCFLKVRQDSRKNAWQAAEKSAAHQKTTKPGKTRMGGIVWILLLSTMIFPLFTVLSNPDPIMAGPRVIPGLRIYDALSVIGATVFSILPFMLGQRFLNTTDSHVTLLKTLCFAMLGYSLLALWEVRMSPQLNVKIYGYFPHMFLQHMRANGFRPVVFFDHGLSLGLFISMSFLSTLAIWRYSKERAAKATIWLFFAGWLLFTLVLAKTIGPLAIALVLLPFAALAGVRIQLVLAAALSAVVLFYPMLRGAGYIPTDEIYEFALERSPERAQSLKFRLDNEDSLLEKANQRPVTGWGTWGRNQIFDQYTGDMVSVTDGMWVIIIGTFGWLGYIARFGLLTLPAVLLALNRRRFDISIATSGLALALAANLVDLLPNAALTPITWLLAGALMGRCIHPGEAAPQPETQLNEAPSDDPAIPLAENPVIARRPRTDAARSLEPKKVTANVTPSSEKAVLKQRKKRME